MKLRPLLFTILLAAPGGMASAQYPAPGTLQPSNYAAMHQTLVNLEQQGVLSAERYGAAQRKLLAQTVFTLGELDQHPRRISSGNFNFNFDFGGPGSTARSYETVIDYVVLPNGRVGNIRPVIGAGTRYTDEWMEYISQWIFAPGTKDGQPVATILQVHRRMNIQGRPVDSSMYTPF